ncbi:MAG: oligosaccharide flippase family protein [Clostridiales bacterium]|nr:oligosaccharide flippase family protein [Clostridiales bacterium]
MNRKKLMRDTVLLTGSSLVMRCIALVFQMWLVSRIGAAGVGLYGLVGSVGFLAATVAISGIRFASTRLISEELGLKRDGGVGHAMRLCMAYSVFFGVSSALVLYLCAEPIGFLWVGDARTVMSLRILSLSLPFISLSSVLYGYFTASGRIFKAAVVQVTEQLIRIGLVVAFLDFAPEGDLEKSCAAVCGGGTAAELCSFLLMLAVYLDDRRKYGKKSSSSPRLPARMLSIAVPLALSAYARSSLSTIEQLLVPRGLKKAGYSANGALAGYGTIQGMVFPIIFFPSCIISALAELIVPELTAAQVSGKKDEISKAVSTLLRKSLGFSLFIGLMLFILSEMLGGVIYKSEDAGYYLRIFSLLVPIMYMDMVTDGCLKGLGEHLWSMAFNIMDALSGVILVYTLLPKFALNGYIGIIFFEEIFNFSLSIWRLSRVTEIKIFDIKERKKCRCRQ